MTTGKQDQEFIEWVINSRLLESAIEWISSNLEPEDVFAESDLRFWAINNGMVDEEG